MYAVGGLPFLTFFAAAIISAAVFMSWRLMKGDATDRLILMCLALTSMVPVWTVRPHVFTLFLVMAVVHLSLRRQYRPIPLIFVVWANLHGGVAMGLVVLGGVLVGRLYVMGRDEAWRVGIVLAASTAATFLTPLGVSLWTTIPESIHKSSVNQIVEWSFASPLDGTYTAFWLLVVVFSATTLVSWRRIRSDEHAVLVAVAFALLPLALRSRRNIPPFMLIAVPALTHNLALSMANWGKRRDKPLTPLQAKVTTLFLALSMAASIIRRRRGMEGTLITAPMAAVASGGDCRGREIASASSTAIPTAARSSGLHRAYASSSTAGRIRIRFRSRRSTWLSTGRVSIRRCSRVMACSAPCCPRTH